MELVATGLRGQQNSLLYHCPPCPVQNVLFFQGDTQDLRAKMESQFEEISQWKSWCLENTLTLLQHKFPDSAVWIVRPCRMLRYLFSCFHNFVQSSIVGIPTYSTGYGAVPHIELLLLDAIQQAHLKGQLRLPPRVCFELPLVLVGFSKGCVVLNQVLHELVNYVGFDHAHLHVPPSVSPHLRHHGHHGHHRKTPSISSISSLSSVEDAPAHPNPPAGHAPYHHHGNNNKQQQQQHGPQQQQQQQQQHSSNPQSPIIQKKKADNTVAATPATVAAASNNSNNNIATAAAASATTFSSSGGSNSSPILSQAHSHSSSSIHRHPSVSSLSSDQGGGGGGDYYQHQHSGSGGGGGGSGRRSRSRSPMLFSRSGSSSNTSQGRRVIALTEDDVVRLRQLLARLKAAYWLDAGHSGGYGAWVTDDDLLRCLAALGTAVHVHVTPQQVCDPNRGWIREEEREFVDRLRYHSVAVTEVLHFEHEERSLENHFRVLNVF